MTEVTLVEVKRGGGTYRLTASVGDDGSLTLEGYDSTSAGSAMGDDDYEYFYRVAAADKDRLLLALLQALADPTDVTTSTTLKELMKANDVPYKFSSWI